MQFTWGGGGDKTKKGDMLLNMELEEPPYLELTLFGLAACQGLHILGI